MSEITSLDRIVEQVRGKKKKLVVAGGAAPTVIESIARAVEEEIVEAVLVGDREAILKLAAGNGIDPDRFAVVHEPALEKVTSRAVELVRGGEAEFLMKGLINTADYMRAILNKERGLVPAGGLLTHVTVVETLTYHKLLIVSDVAIIVQPTLLQKIAMLEFCTQIAHAIGIEIPKAAIISCVEKPSYKIESTVDGDIMRKLAARSQLKGAIVDGPLALDLALSKRAAREKGFESPVAGDVDIMIFPNICSGNVFFKTVTYLAGGRIAALVTGAQVPCVLTSRSDTEESKFVSIALGALMA